MNHNIKTDIYWLPTSHKCVERDTVFCSNVQIFLAVTQHMWNSCKFQQQLSNFKYHLFFILLKKIYSCCFQSPAAFTACVFTPPPIYLPFSSTPFIYPSFSLPLSPLSLSGVQVPGTACLLFSELQRTHPPLPQHGTWMTHKKRNRSLKVGQNFFHLTQHSCKYFDTQSSGNPCWSPIWEFFFFKSWLTWRDINIRRMTY